MLEAIALSLAYKKLTYRDGVRSWKKSVLLVLDM